MFIGHALLIPGDPRHEPIESFENIIPRRRRNCMSREVHKRRTKRECGDNDVPARIRLTPVGPRDQIRSNEEGHGQNYDLEFLGDGGVTNEPKNKRLIRLSGTVLINCFHQSVSYWLMTFGWLNCIEEAWKDVTRAGWVARTQTDQFFSVTSDKTGGPTGKERYDSKLWLPVIEMLFDAPNRGVECNLQKFLMLCTHTVS